MDMRHRRWMLPNLLLISGRDQVVKSTRAVFLSLLTVLGAHVPAKPGQEPRDTTSRLGSISGHITIEGKPGAGLGLSLFLGEYPYGQPVATAVTGGDGRYHFSELPSAHYWLKVDSPGCVNADGSFDNRTGRRVGVASGESVDNADLDLVRVGAISGRILGIDGSPVVNEQVQLTPAHNNFAMRPISLAAGPFTTDSSGAFRIFGIPPGDYLVSIGVDLARLSGAVWDKYDDWGQFGRVAGDHYYEETFCPGVTDRQKAQIIRVVAGSDVTGIDITAGRPRRSFSVSGRVADVRTGQGIGNCGLQVMQRVNQGYRGASTGGLQEEKPDQNGNFTLSGFIPGSFFIGATFYEGNGDLYGSRLDFEIKDSDVTGLQVKACHGLSVEGKLVVAEGDKDAVSKAGDLKLTARLKIEEVGPIDWFREVPVNSDGGFRIGGLRRGEVVIDISPSSPSSFLSLVRIEYPSSDGDGQIQASSADGRGGPIRVGDKDIKGVRVIVAYKNASIKCHVAIVGTIPANMRLSAWVSRSNGISMPPLDANGEFTLEGLEPGDYEVSIGDGGRRLTETKTVRVQENAQANVSFVLDLDRKIER
jgi:hypothetical protein